MNQHQPAHTQYPDYYNRQSFQEQRRPVMQYTNPYERNQRQNEMQEESQHSDPPIDYYPRLHDEV